MTASDKFTHAISERWQGYVIDPGACRGCKECYSWLEGEALENPTERDTSIAEDGSFSRYPCDSCGSTLGGNRHHAHAILASSFGKPTKPGDITHIEVCSDCLMYHANGDLPDSWE